MVARVSLTWRTSLASLLLIAGCLVTTAGAQSPPYVVLRGPSGRHAPRHQYGPYPRATRPVIRSTYAYGWFGAAPRQHWSRHFGYYRNFTQWSAR